MIHAGDQAPDFSLPDQTGTTHALRNCRGAWVLLYFYPKDDTPGCTVEACEFRDAVKTMEKMDAVVLGISPDGVASHSKFIEKFKLPFILLSDEDKKVCGDYGVWIKKSMYGREYMGVARTTFIIGQDGNLKKIFEKVKPQGHAEEVLNSLKNA